MTDYVKFGILAAVVACVYYAGYNRAETAGELAIESLKREQAQAVIDAQAKEKVKYEKQISDLVDRLNALGGQYSDRMRELEQFRANRGDLEACYRQRDDLASLAVRGERLLERALAYLSVQQ